MRGRLSLLVFLSVAVILAAGSAWASPTVEIDGRYWFTKISGSINLPDSSSLPATDIDLNSDLNLDKYGAPDVRLIWHTGSNSWLRVAYTHLDYSGTNPSLSRTITFNGQQFNASTSVSSQLKINYVSVGWAWQFLHIANIVKFGPLLQAKGFFIDASMDDPDLAINESKNVAFGLPTVGAALDVNPPVIPVSVFAEFSGMTLGKYGHLYDTEAGLKVSPPIPFLYLEGGYRIFELVGHYNANSVDVRIKGPFVGARLAF